MKNKLSIIEDESFCNYKTGASHPESPGRFSSIIRALEDQGYKKYFLKPRPASFDEISLAHSPEYIHQVIHETQECKFQDGSESLSTGDVQITALSYPIAALAAGSVIVGVDQVMKEKASSSFCVVRPPGHHACKSVGMGFCLFNNVAIGARYAIDHYQIKRVLIVDWDVHHGNGTQDIFWDDPRVFYFSTHQFPLYPGTGARNEKGVGNILNCPITPGRLARVHVLNAFEVELRKAMEVFRPEIIFISAGFDAHYMDPLGGLNLTTQDFGALTLIMKNLAHHYADGKLISVLEGGYNLQALADSSLQHVKILESYA